MRVDIKELERLSKVDVREVDRSTLKELDDIKVNRKLPVKERVKGLLSQVENPYIHLDHGIVVKISFSENGKTLQDCMETYLSTELLTG